MGGPKFSKIELNLIGRLPEIVEVQLHDTSIAARDIDDFRTRHPHCRVYITRQSDRISFATRALVRSTPTATKPPAWAGASQASAPATLRK